MKRDDDELRIMGTDERDVRDSEASPYNAVSRSSLVN